MLGDIAQRIATVLPRYGAAVWAILCRPISETLPRAANPAVAVDALVFWAISILISSTVRMLVFDAPVDVTRYFVSRMLGELAVLAGLALAFALASRIAQVAVPVRGVLAAIALLWAAVLPLLDVLNASLYAFMLFMSPGLFEEMKQFLFSCSGGVGLVDEMSIFGDLARSGDTGAWLSILLFLGIGAISIALCVIYTVAFLRVLGRLGGATGARFAGLVILGLGLGTPAVAVASAFGWMIGRGMGGCG